MYHARCQRVANAWAHRCIFNEGDVADKLYVVVTGRVGMFKTVVNADAAGQIAEATGSKLLVEFTSSSKYPWFGEAGHIAAVQADGGVGMGVEPPRRGATAFTSEWTQCLSIRSSLVRRAPLALGCMPCLLLLGHMPRAVHAQHGSNLFSTCSHLGIDPLTGCTQPLLDPVGEAAV